jgi:hypothetical protein
VDLKERRRTAFLRFGELGAGRWRRRPPAEAEIAPCFDIRIARERHDDLPAHVDAAIRIVAEAGFDDAVADEHDGGTIQPRRTDDPRGRGDLDTRRERPLCPAQIQHEARTIASPAQHRHRLAIARVAGRLQPELLEPRFEERERHGLPCLSRATTVEVVGAERAHIRLDTGGGQDRRRRIGRSGEDEEQGKPAFHGPQDDRKTGPAQAAGDG